MFHLRIWARTARQRGAPTATSPRLRRRRSARAGAVEAAATAARSRRRRQPRIPSPPAASFDPDVSKWDAWRPEPVAELLTAVEAPWYVAAGWAIDLFLGGEHREHEDLEIAVPNARFDEVVDVLAGLEIFVITGPHEATPLAEARDRLGETHQSWVREPATGLWRFDVFREPSDRDTWLCRRDESIRLPYEEVIEWTDDGIPYGRPEIVLLFKAKHTRDRDQADFEAVVPRLEPERRRWLAEALERVHPGHRWLDGLK
jgi:Aminoglycoside-2''-adenylyltransferase